ncbi:2-methylisocitrate lyase [Bosea thiooxidans]
MPYLVASELPSEPAGRRFRALVEGGGIARLPGAHNGMAALQAKAAGFEGLYLSGAAMTASMGIPDLGIITVDEVAFFIRQVARASGLPLLVDGDTGYGEALNVMHMVRVFEEAGAGAVHIEDQLLPKKCGHLNDKKLADAHDMAAKVAAAAKARPASLCDRPYRRRSQRRHRRRGGHGRSSISRPAPTRSSRRP